MQIDLILDEPTYSEPQNYYLIPVRFTPQGPRAGAPKEPNPWRAIAVDFEEALTLLDALHDGAEITVRVLSVSKEIRIAIYKTYPRRGDRIVNLETGEHQTVA